MMEISVQRKPLNNKELNSIGGRVQPEERKSSFNLYIDFNEYHGCGHAIRDTFLAI